MTIEDELAIELGRDDPKKLRLIRDYYANTDLAETQKVNDAILQYKQHKGKQ